MAAGVSPPAFAAGREPPAIVTQPTGQTVLPGALASFTVEVSSKTAPTYQWRFATADLLESSKYSGVTTPTLRISDVTPQDTGDYSVVVSNRGGAITSAVATLALASADSCLPPPGGLIGWWPGDGSARDLVGTNHGTLEGGATADSNGMVGAAFNFDGTNKYVQIPDAPELNPQILSVECWVRFDNLDAPGTSVYLGQQYLVFKQNERSDNFEGYVLSKDRTFADVILWEVTSASGQLVRIDTTSTVTTNVWYHLVGTRGSNFIQLYFNGRLEAEASVDFPQNYGSLPLYFGTSGQAYWDRRLNGCLDEVALYNRVLTAAEIEALYASGPFGKCKGTNGIIINRQPENQSAPIGGTATFTVTASGAGPLAYQWQFDGATLAGATNSMLSLTNVQPAQAGAYTVVVTNRVGAVTSAPARLTVLVAPVLKDARMVSNGLFGFTLVGDPGTAYLIEASSDLTDWSEIGAVTNVTGQVQFFDTMLPPINNSTIAAGLICRSNTSGLQNDPKNGS